MLAVETRASKVAPETGRKQSGIMGKVSSKSTKIVECEVLRYTETKGMAVFEAENRKTKNS